MDSASEVWHCLYMVNVCKDIEVYFIRRRNRAIGGLIAIVFDADPILAIRKVRGYLEDRPWIMRYTLRIVPVEMVTGSLEELSRFVSNVANARIGESETWRISVSKRASKVSSRKLIESLASNISKGSVNLETPDWIINVEAIRQTYLCAVIKPEDIIRKKDVSIRLRSMKPLNFLHET